ncbi:MAG: hypothetical protein E4G99_11240 [Anaerolineales bacterium]|nr:MAG: hypothetical protein E4G99_11240 [Anaerolineales bacterium]
MSCPDPGQGYKRSWFSRQVRSLRLRIVQASSDHILHGYIFRRTAISLLLNSGADPFAVQKLAGHSDVRLTTQTYAHVQADALRRAVGLPLVS